MLMTRQFFAVASCAVLTAFSSGLIAAPKDLQTSGLTTSNATTSAPATPTAELGVKADPEIGQQINGVCAGCHGPLGEGGKKGEYPRLAGQNFEYLKAQLIRFKERRRVNIPMFPYTEERELSDADIVHISAYLAGIKLDTALPVFKENEDALARLTAMAKVFNVPRAEGDVDAGAKLYKQECASCHGLKGLGYKENPMLAGQYTQYLKRQINKFTAGERIHDKDLDEDLTDREKDVLNQLKPEEIRDILAYLSVLNY
jgi:cytochrome c553